MRAVPHYTFSPPTRLEIENKTLLNQFFIMLKEAKELTAMGVSQAVADFVFAEGRNNKVLNSEGLEVGNKIKILGIADKPTTSVINGQEQSWIDVLTDGDRSTVSISRLVGTEKMSYFDKSREGKDENGNPLVELIDGFDTATRFKFPRREADALEEVMKNVGNTFVCAGIARGCGANKDRTYVVWKQVTE